MDAYKVRNYGMTDYVKYTVKLLYEMGYSVNAEDQCVFNRMASSNQITICVHVDDLLMTCIDQKVMNSEVEKLVEIFGSLSVSYGKMQNYLGMVFDFTTEGTDMIEMKNNIEELLKYTETKTSAPTSAEVNLLDVNDKNELLSDVERAKFHTVVAKLLYLAKRVRPDRHIVGKSYSSYRDCHDA